jgi:hypothetical protein
MKYQYNDGGRAAAGFKGTTGDCVVRAIAIASGKRYSEVYNDLKLFTGKSPRNGVSKTVTRKYIESLGFKWTPTMAIGSGCKVHLEASQLPSGKIICKLSRHLVAVVDGVVHDTYDSTRDGNRCVYGYWSKIG